MSSRRAALSKALRARSRVQFQLSAAHNAHVWQRGGPGEGVDPAQRCRELTWQLIDLDEWIRALEFGPWPPLIDELSAAGADVSLSEPNCALLSRATR